MAFQPTFTDYQLSPYTGMTRKSWLAAAKYMLEGIFRHIPDMEAPVVVPRQETEITYPHADATGDARKIEEKAEIFEGLTRSFFIAAPLIQNEPDVEICGFSLREYYKHQILRTCTPGDKCFVGTYEELQELTGQANKFRAFQQTVETCALVIGLWVSEKEIWETYTKEEKDRIAALLSSFAHANTVPQNWRLFNMLDLAFLHRNGYSIDREIMLDHAQAILDYYVGDGWYRDGQSFDYYSCWAFQFYAPLWNVWYGYENEPYLAEKFEEHSNRLMETYADFFDRDGFVNMWGRSNIYRFAAVSAFDGNFLLKHPAAKPGVARRISSGALLQFLGREDFCVDGIPTMGFYKQFAPLVQGYSCAESPFWMGKAFLCLHLPEDHPFWTAKEENGTWEELSGNAVKETVLNGPALAFTNHAANGATILRTGKVVKHQNNFHGMWNYSKLSYHTKYPWESTPDFQENFSIMEISGHFIQDGESQPRTEISASLVRGDIESQQYVLKDGTDGHCSLANATFWAGEKDGVLYRKQYFDYRTDVETHWTQGMYLADFPVALGLFRVDKIKLFRRPVVLTLGSYGFPDNGTEIRCLEKDGAKAIWLKGKDAAGRPKQLAMSVFGGFMELGYLRSTGTNPDSDNSIVIFAVAGLQKQYGGCEPYVFLSQIITKEEETDFTEDEIFPVKQVVYTDAAGCGTYGPVRVCLKDGTEKAVDYAGVEGKLSL